MAITSNCAHRLQQSAAKLLTKGETLFKFENILGAILVSLLPYSLYKYFVKNSHTYIPADPSV